MIIDFHAHTFPEQIVERAIAKLSQSAHIKNYLDGTLHDLKFSMHGAGIDYAVLLPVVTKPAQQETINRTAIQINDLWQETGILSFGGIHPENDNYREILRNLARHGVRGIKLHPVFQQTYFDDIRYLRIMECACENNLMILTHAGFDVSFPNQDFVTPERISAVLEQVHPDKLVLAHMGGWGCWNEVEEMLTKYDIWLDTSFTLSPVRSNDGKMSEWSNQSLKQEQFLRMVRAFGAKRILFGTDSPWADLSESLALIREIGLTPSELQDILGANAANLIGISADTLR